MANLSLPNLHRHGPDVQPDLAVAGGIAEGFERRVARFRLRLRHQSRRLELQQGRAFRRLNVVGFLSGSLADQSQSVGHIAFGVPARAHLNQGGAKSRLG